MSYHSNSKPYANPYVPPAMGSVGLDTTTAVAASGTGLLLLGVLGAMGYLMYTHLQDDNKMDDPWERGRIFREERARRQQTPEFKAAWKRMHPDPRLMSDDELERAYKRAKSDDGGGYSHGDGMDGERMKWYTAVSEEYRRRLRAPNNPYGLSNSDFNYVLASHMELDETPQDVEHLRRMVRGLETPRSAWSVGEEEWRKAAGLQSNGRRRGRRRSRLQ